jgi:hypothetical protein
MKPRTIRLPEDLDSLLQDEAEKTGTTEAEIIRRVLCDYYRIRKGETSIEALIRRVVEETLADSTLRAPVSTSRSTHKAPQSTPEKEDRAPPRTLEAPPGAPLVSTSRAPESTSKKEERAPIEHLRAPPEKRIDGLEWGEKRKHRLSDDPVGTEELKTLWRLEPRPTFTEIGRLLGGYSRDIISDKVKELIAKGELEE